MSLWQRIAYFPLSLFTMVMGLAGITIAWQKAAVFEPSISVVANVLAAVTSCVFVVLSAAFAIKILRYSAALRREVNHPIQVNFLPAVSIALLLLSVIWQAQNPYVFMVWSLGAALQFVFTLFVVNQWVYNPEIPIHTANPAWYIPAVGNIIVPISGVYFGYSEVSWFFFAVGIGFWVVLTAVILMRLFFHEPLPDKLKPTLLILLAPPSVGFVAYTLLAGDLTHGAKMLFYIALFFGLFFASHGLRLLRLHFFLSSWAFSFPVAALTIACYQMALLSGSLLWENVAGLLLVTTSLIVLALLIKTVLAFRQKTICMPGT